jgi:DNA-binding transcriptional LysR family regulator
VRLGGPVAALVRDAVASDRLVRLLPEHEASARSLHILYAPDRRLTPRLRSFIDFAITRFGS